MGDGTLTPPIVGYIYRGFLISPPIAAVDATQVYSYDYEVRTSADDDVWTDWSYLGSGTKNTTNYNFIHDSLYKEIFYQYRYKITYTDGSRSDYSGTAIPGNGTLIFDYSGIDQLAANIGTISSGFMRGVIFETSANYPKVRMDPTGFYSISPTSTPIFINAQTGDALFTGALKPHGIRFDFTPATWGGFFFPGGDFTDPGSVAWHADTNGAPSAIISLQSALGAQTLQLLATPYKAGVGGAAPQIEFRAQGISPTMVASLLVACHGDPYGSGSTSFIMANLEDIHGNLLVDKIIYQADGGSDFLQIAKATSERKINWGTGTVTFSASATSSTETVSHGLGTSPSVILLQGVKSGKYAIFEFNNVTSSSFDVTAWGTDSTTQNKDFYWTAIS